MFSPLAAMFASPMSLRGFLLFGALLTLYVVGRLTMGAIPRRIDSSTLRAMLGLFSVLVVGIVAVLMNRPNVALHLPISAAGAALTLGVGAVILGRGVPAANVFSGSRSWIFALPAVALVVIAAVSGRLDPVALLVLVAYGTAALLAWLPDRLAPFAIGRPVSASASETREAVNAQPIKPDAAAEARAGSRTFAGVVWLGCVALTALAGVMAMLGLPALEAIRRGPADAVAVMFFLAPAIVVPMIFELLPPCRPTGWIASISTLVKFAVMCLCIALPAIALIGADVDLIRGWRETLAQSIPAATQPAAGLPSAATTPSATTDPATTAPADATFAFSWPELTFPNVPYIAITTDVLALAAGALMLLPIAAGWLRPGKLEAMALFLCYATTLALAVAAVLN